MSRQDQGGSAAFAIQTASAGARLRSQKEAWNRKQGQGARARQRQSGGVQEKHQPAMHEAAKRNTSVPGPTPTFVIGCLAITKATMMKLKHTHRFEAPSVSLPERLSEKITISK